jgi:hypothetical protein
VRRQSYELSSLIRVIISLQLGHWTIRQFGSTMIEVLQEGHWTV